MNDAEANERAKLLAARDELTAVLRKHQLVGYLAVAGQLGRCEAISHLEAPWFKAKMIETGTGYGLRVTSKLADYGGDKAAKHRDLESTGAALSSVAEMMGRSGMVLLGLMTQLDKVLGAEHTPLRPDDPTKQ